MSIKLVNHNPDLKQLMEEGYEVEVYSGYLLIYNIPYVNSKREIAYGTLVSVIENPGVDTIRARDHVAQWVGDLPCNAEGLPLSNLVINTNTRLEIREGLVATHTFSQKPKPAGQYKDHHHKMTTYVNYLEIEAQVIQPRVTAKTFARVVPLEDESAFYYMDTASSRAGISAINDKLKKNKIGIIGLGGTGAYVLDLVSKTPVEEIHLFDGDEFLPHNAFRSPGAASIEDLQKRPTKVKWFAENYSKMKRKIIQYPQYINASNISELKSLDFVFLCIDKGESRRDIVKYLIENEKPFIDVGMGVNNVNGSLFGLIRATTCTPSFNKHVETTMPFNDGVNPEYSLNIQIADLNALNAALAVIKWKKMCGFYIDLDPKHHSVYSTNTNIITNEDNPNEAKSD